MQHFQATLLASQIMANNYNGNDMKLLHTTTISSQSQSSDINIYELNEDFSVISNFENEIIINQPCHRIELNKYGLK